MIKVEIGIASFNIYTNDIEKAKENAINLYYTYYGVIAKPKKVTIIK